jgi:hypothetical protein
MGDTNNAKQADLAFSEAFEALKPFHPRNQDHSVFSSDEHLTFSPPTVILTLADMGLNDDTATTPFAVSGNFPLFTAAAIRKMKEELFTEEVQQKFQKSGRIVNRQLRGMVPKCVLHPKKRNMTNGLFTSHAKFTYNAWTHPDTLAAISGVAGIDLVPVMDIEISHVNILESSDGSHNKYPVGWHRDDYPYVCVLRLSDTSDMNGGRILLKGGNGILALDPPEMVSLIEIQSLLKPNSGKGSAYLLQGRCIEHAVEAFKGCTEQLTAVTSFRPRSPFLQDQTRLCNVLKVSDLSELYSQFYQYRMVIFLERLKRWWEILDGEADGEAVLNSLFLNIESIRKFLCETCEQLGMRVNNNEMPASLEEANTVNLKALNFPIYTVMFSLKLKQAARKLMGEVREQRDRGGFDLKMAIQTIESVDNILSGL